MKNFADTRREFMECDRGRYFIFSSIIKRFAYSRCCFWCKFKVECTPRGYSPFQHRISKLKPIWDLIIQLPGNVNYRLFVRKSTGEVWNRWNYQANEIIWNKIQVMSRSSKLSQDTRTGVLRATAGPAKWNQNPPRAFPLSFSTTTYDTLWEKLMKFNVVTILKMKTHQILRIGTSEVLCDSANNKKSHKYSSRRFNHEIVTIKYCYMKMCTRRTFNFNNTREQTITWIS